MGVVLALVGLARELLVRVPRGAEAHSRDWLTLEDHSVSIAHSQRLVGF